MRDTTDPWIFESRIDRRSAMQLLLLLAGTAIVPVGVAKSAASEAGHDFDPMFGTWHAEHRRLKKRLAGSTEWTTFDGTQVRQPVLGGQANFDDNIFHLPDGDFRGLTMQSFDPKTNIWLVWWLDGRDPRTLDAPMTGSFDAGTGRFYVDDTFAGKPIKVRFVWSEITPKSHKWEQAFSPDGGNTWETNWTTRYTRAS